MDKNVHALLFSKGVYEAAGLSSKEEKESDTRILQVILDEGRKETPDFSTIDTLMECFAGMTSSDWMKEKTEIYNQALVEAWKRVSKIERDKAVVGVCTQMVKCSMFAMTKPGFPILPAAVIAALHPKENDTETIPEEVRAAKLKESDYLYGIGQVLALWVNRRPSGHIMPWNTEELKGMYKDCVTTQIPEGI